MDTDAEIESEYFRDQFIARNLADEEDDASDLPRTNYGTIFEGFYRQLTVEEQKPFVDEIFQAVDAHRRDSKTNRFFFLTGAGGTGKTFVYNVCVLCAYASI